MTQELNRLERREREALLLELEELKYYWEQAKEGVVDDKTNFARGAIRNLIRELTDLEGRFWKGK